MDRMSTHHQKNPHDKNTGTRLTEKEQMVLYPQHQKRHSQPLRDHDLVECADPNCPTHAHLLFNSLQDRQRTRQEMLNPYSDEPAIRSGEEKMPSKTPAAQSDPQQAKAEKLPVRPLSSCPMSLQMSRPDCFRNTSSTCASYNPKFVLVQPNLGRGNLSIAKAVSREKLPCGRPFEAANLVELPRDNGESIDP